MANIAIINYCNLQCPYCFANEYFTEGDKQVITGEQLDKILEFIGRTKVGRVGLIGGEPTIHPNFPEILKKVQEFCITHDTHCTIFTNGIELYNYARSLDDRTGCLINLNHPDIVGETNWNKILRSLERVKLCNAMDRVSFGINLYPTMKDYDYLFELALNYSKEYVRVSYVAPTCQFSNVNKDDYYTEAKTIFLAFVDKAREYGVKVHLDCNHIPECYFTEEEMDFISPIVDGFHSYCEPVVDITPDFQGTACFGAYKLYDLHKFDNLIEVERYLRYKRLYPLSVANAEGKCGSCPKHDNLSCQGGCLAFVNE